MQAKKAYQQDISKEQQQGLINETTGSALDYW